MTGFAAIGLAPNITGMVFTPPTIEFFAESVEYTCTLGDLCTLVQPSPFEEDAVREVRLIETGVGFPGCENLSRAVSPRWKGADTTPEYDEAVDAFVLGTLNLENAGPGLFELCWSLDLPPVDGPPCNVSAQSGRRRSGANCTVEGYGQYDGEYTARADRNTFQAFERDDGLKLFHAGGAQLERNGVDQSQYWIFAHSWDTEWWPWNGSNQTQPALDKHGRLRLRGWEHGWSTVTAQLDTHEMLAAKDVNGTYKTVDIANVSVNCRLTRNCSDVDMTDLSCIGSSRSQKLGCLEEVVNRWDLLSAEPTGGRCNVASCNRSMIINQIMHNSSMSVAGPRRQDYTCYVGHSCDVLLYGTRLRSTNLLQFNCWAANSTNGTNVSVEANATCESFINGTNGSLVCNDLSCLITVFVAPITDMTRHDANALLALFPEIR
jgi:hypothetical protein